MSKRENITDQEVAEISFEIIEKLNGLPMGEALHVLNATKCWLLDCHRVDTSNQRFTTKSAEVSEFDSSCSGSSRLHRK